jgi:hypothetical protein
MHHEPHGIEREGDLCGNGPHKGDEFTGHGHHDLIGAFTAGAELSVTFTQPYRRFPPDVLDRFGSFSRRSCRWRLTFVG